MKKLDLVVLLCLLTFIAPLAGFAADRTGIDCGCDEVGTYNVLSKGSLPAIVITGVNEGTSQNGTYEFTVGTRRLSENSLGPPEKNLKVFSDMLVSKS